MSTDDRHAPRRTSSVAVTVVFLLAVWSAAPAAACPFCTALKPTLCQRRESAQFVALGELQKHSGDAAEFLLHDVRKGAGRLKRGESAKLLVKVKQSAGTLVLLFGEGAAGDPPARLRWTAQPVNETSYAYFARAPSLRKSAPERLAYFAPRLEHADPLVAEDAWQEFGHAPYDDVAKVADRLSASRLRAWLVDEGVPQTRKGFYGMALGIAGPLSADGLDNAAFLRSLILRPADDFRAGFDGVLAGYLLATGQQGLTLIEDRYLANPKAAVGDVRHAMSALRFYHESGREIPARRLAEALRHALARPEFAAEAITDLARWRDWDALPLVAPLYDRKGFTDSDIRRAIVGYLLVCPRPRAAERLAELRRRDPEGIAAAEKALTALGTAKQ